MVGAKLGNLHDSLAFNCHLVECAAIGCEHGHFSTDLLPTPDNDVDPAGVQVQTEADALCELPRNGS